MQRTIRAICILLLVLLLWEELIQSGFWNAATIPNPLAVLKYFTDLNNLQVLWTATVITLRRLILGYLLSILIGIPLGLACARFTLWRDTLGLLALGLQALPSVCWVPLGLIWLGDSEAAMIFIVVTGSLWPIIIATEGAVLQIPKIYLRAAHTMGSKGLHTWLYVRLPAALPQLVAALKQSWAFAWRALMAAEIYVAVFGGSGLGKLLQIGREQKSTEMVLALMLVMIVIGLVTDKGLFLAAERGIRRRWGVLN